MDALPDYSNLAALMFPKLNYSREELEIMYPPRSLHEGAKVTRIAPSPTGYLHIGTMFTAMVNRIAAGKDGVFYFRLEDTDKKREVDGGMDNIVDGLLHYGIKPDEGISGGEYGPYKQSQRAGIYHVYARSLIEQGLAYPCFCSEECRAEARVRQGECKQRTGYYGEYAICRRVSPDEAERRIKAGEAYVVRLRSPGSEDRRIVFDDLIKGKIEMPENDEDVVLLKSDGIPTYHFAHAVDDHLMRTTHVIRGDEWIASVPKHIQLFYVLGWKPPKYAHVSPIMKEENGNKRKLSKRKDPEAAVHFYAEQGYPVEGVIEYLHTVASSEFEDWHKRNRERPISDFPFNIKKMSVSGALFDLDKLNDVSKSVISYMNADEVADAVTEWAGKYDNEFYSLISRDREYAVGIFGIDRGGKKPRKDIAKWSDAPGYAAYFFDNTFRIEDTIPENISQEDAIEIIRAYLDVYDESHDSTQWFSAIKEMCPQLGFCPDVKEYKHAPGTWKGHVGDVTTVIRIAVSGRKNTPDLCAIMRLLGKERVQSRFFAFLGE